MKYDPRNFTKMPRRSCEVRLPNGAWAECADPDVARDLFAGPNVIMRQRRGMGWKLYRWHDGERQWLPD